MLAGLRVLDIASFIAAPATATVLGDFGADVVKVEPPDGDPHRLMSTGTGMPVSDVNYCWELDSRNKRSIALDLKNPAGRAALDRLIASADVLITNYPPPARERLRLRYADVAPLNARLVYASLSGYGEEGPDRDRPGYDVTTYFARSGIVETMRRADLPPSLTLPAQGDHPSAMTLFGAIMMALYARERSGVGGEVATSLLHNGVWSNGLLAQAALLGAYPEPRRGREFARNALANVYQARDGRWLSLVIVREDKLWGPLCRAVGLPALEGDPRFATKAARAAHPRELMALLDAAFAARDLDDWRRALTAADITFGTFARLQDLPDDPQLAASGVVVETGRADLPRTIPNPIRAAMAPQVPAGPAPALGADTDAVLRDAGFDAAEIAELRRCGAAR
ncbi:MAG: CoA transferase [Rhodospirillales bacterium]|nr:MAG: CoA transferase [Rhodospirillales bacterium]